MVLSPNYLTPRTKCVNVLTGDEILKRVSVAGQRRHKVKAVRPPSNTRPVLARASPDASAKFPIVGIGASAGGLDACKRLVNALPAHSGIAFILVQHLDPTHQSMMADLLATHTAMTVVQATDGMLVEPDHLYIIPPATYLAMGNGLLHLSQPLAPHGARLPFDFLLHSLATDAGARAVCIILSGTGADGSLGLKSIKEKCGLVMAQDPAEAGFDGMPRSAIMTGSVDLVLPAAEIAKALVKYVRRLAHSHGTDNAGPEDKAQDWLPDIIELLRTKTAYNFTLYKEGTLQRRVIRRMAMAAIENDDMNRYLEMLRSDGGELDLLAKDLLINVTSFFRDRTVFELLAEKTIPDLIRDHGSDRPLRIWVAGCSTGEETYSLAMLFREAITESKRNITLQVFASDVDPDAIAKGREGVYPETISADVSAERLARFFTKEDHGYRVTTDLRAAVVFTVQDVLSDPPFSRIDFISCRNLLIYLLPEAQTKIISLFHFALREGGVLLLGSSETVGNDDGRFEIVSKPERLYRQIGHRRPGEFGITKITGDGTRVALRLGPGPPPSRQTAIAELCRRLVMKTYAPAAVLINRKHECLYSVGPIDRFLQVAPGHPNIDLLAMARQGFRTKLRSAIQQARQKKVRVTVPGGQINHDGKQASFSIDVQPVPGDAEDLLLVCFIDDPKEQQSVQTHTTTLSEVVHGATLEQELDATRAELQGAIRNLEVSNDEQKAINEEALSVNEEFQSTNEELLTSKEELQSLNEELTALNSQLQETLERQRTASNDLQNVLYSTDVATLFLDTRLNIRFFTPATKSLFNIISTDIGRPLGDLNSLASDADLLTDAKKVLQNFTPIEREIEAQGENWYIRRILPYRTQDNRVAGVVITFANITERRRTAQALQAAKRQAELATTAKSRFLAAASHDLRQPLQTLALLQGLLAKVIEGDKAKNLLGRLDETLGAMSGMLNALLDINQIEAGIVRAEMADFPVNDLLHRLRSEFNYHAQAKGLVFRKVPCGLVINSDQRLLEQVIRNLLSNALKYTKKGKILLGCRRRDDVLSIEVWDTGAGIPPEELQDIFEEYHQLDNATHQTSLGLGLGLAIVQRLGKLLGHRIHVRSWLGKGSVFAVDVNIRTGRAAEPPERHPTKLDVFAMSDTHRTGEILIVDDDPNVRELLETSLRSEGHHVTTASEGAAALELIARGAFRPDVILADFNLPHGMDGLEVAAKLREKLHWPIPVIILTGDISTDTLRNIALKNYVQLNKPVKFNELAQAIQDLLPLPGTANVIPNPGIQGETNKLGGPVIYVVDDDSSVREGLREVFEDDGKTVEDFASCEEFLQTYQQGREACLLVDSYLPGMTGLELLQKLQALGQSLPAIMITGNSDVPMAVQAMKAGASDFVEKPAGRGELLASVRRALEQSKDMGKLSAWRDDAAHRVASLTPRQHEIMVMVLAGHPSKNIAADLGISQRTVENHRASIMEKTGSKSLPALARLALAAAAKTGSVSPGG
jgi:two-component system CheB/CheR fusion protein